MDIVRKTIMVEMIYDDSGETYFVLPSGFQNMVIIVNENPVDLTARHLLKDQVDEKFDI